MRGGILFVSTAARMSSCIVSGDALKRWERKALSEAASPDLCHLTGFWAGKPGVAETTHLLFVTWFCFHDFFRWPSVAVEMKTESKSSAELTHLGAEHRVHTVRGGAMELTQLGAEPRSSLRDRATDSV